MIVFASASAAAATITEPVVATAPARTETSWSSELRVVAGLFIFSHILGKAARNCREGANIHTAGQEDGRVGDARATRQRRGVGVQHIVAEFSQD